MKLKKKKRKVSILVPIASMGDIAFLLIIFFMLTSNFMKESKVELEEAESVDIEILKETSISVAVDEDAVIWVQGRECSVDELKANVEDYMAGQNKNTVMLKIDKDLNHEQYGKVLMELSKAGAEIALIGKQIKE
jgi:biopolymer transport protein ExbD